jgi:hypothetical protein
MRSTTGKAYKIMVWATGGVGRYAIRTAADRRNLEFVGAWVGAAALNFGDDVLSCVMSRHQSGHRRLSQGGNPILLGGRDRT